MSRTIKIYKNQKVSGTVSKLPASKSLSNRALLLDALCGGQSEIQNLSEANDTVLFTKLIRSTNPILDAEDAGTTMRFLTAFFAISGKQKTLTGTDRMKLRPIGILVDALRSLGANIEYPEKDGFPPINFKGFGGQKTDELTIQGDVSSQYISALMMVAPTLPKGLSLKLSGKVGSRPYIEMTASLMRKFGVEVEVRDAEVNIAHQVYKPSTYWVEPDWSAASYWFSVAALAQSAELILPKLTLRSLQGDRVIVDIMEHLGVMCEPRGNHILLMKKEHQRELAWDFTHCPDLAQTVSVVCAAKGISGTFTGLESLRIKETDRIKALQTELIKLGAQLVEDGSQWKLIPAQSLPEKIGLIATYLDHRMAMAFAPLATQWDIELENPDVVKKSYPGFWKDMKGAGFKIDES